MPQASQDSVDRMKRQDENSLQQELFTANEAQIDAADIHERSEQNQSLAKVATSDSSFKKRQSKYPASLFSKQGTNITSVQPHINSEPILGSGPVEKGPTLSFWQRRGPALGAYIGHDKVGRISSIVGLDNAHF